jgi:hypothetical protein
MMRLIIYSLLFGLVFTIECGNAYSAVAVYLYDDNNARGDLNSRRFFVAPSIGEAESQAREHLNGRPNIRIGEQLLKCSGPGWFAQAGLNCHPRSGGYGVACSHPTREQAISRAKEECRKIGVGKECNGYAAGYDNGKANQLIHACVSFWELGFSDAPSPDGCGQGQDISWTFPGC